MIRRYQIATLRFCIRFIYLLISFFLIIHVVNRYHEVRFFAEDKYPYQIANCSYRGPTEQIIRIPYVKPSSPIKKQVFVGKQLGQRIFSTDGIRWKDVYNPNDYWNDFYKTAYRIKSASKEFQLVLALSEECSEILPKVANTIQSLHFLQNHFSFRVVYFTTSPSIIRLCKENGIDVVTQYITNYKGLPIVRELYSSLISLYQADYYGYMNSDILISPSIFPVLTQLTNEYNSYQLTDGFLVSGVSFTVPVPEILPLESPEAYALFINDLQHKQQFRNRGSSDFWIFHKTMDFSVLSDVVIGRVKVDSYIMGLLYALDHSIVDVTYAAISLHQGQQDFTIRVKQKAEVADVYYNDFFFKLERIPDFMLSLPGDKVAYWNNRVFEIQDWNGNSEEREKQRENLIREIRTSIYQLPWSI